MKQIRNLFFIVIFFVASFFTISAGTGVDYFEISKNIDIFVTLFKELNINYVDKIDPSTILRKGIDAMLEDLDPYTTFYSEAETEDFRIQTTGKYGGIGSVISQREDYVQIEEPYEGMPAQIAGLKAGDKILEIEGKSMKGKNSEEVSKLLKGTAGTKLNLTISRIQADGNEKKMPFEVIRKEIKLSNVPFSGMASPSVGYIRLENFTENAGADVRAAVKELKEKNKLDGIILDLRGNPGGLLHEAVNTANVFLDQDNEVVTTKGKIVEMQKTYRTQKRAEEAQLPLIVLTNGGSASASEIVAGAIQDLDRGVIVGGKSYGKGLVQSTRPLPYNTQLKVTTAKYYIPSGRCIQAINYAEKNPDGSVKKIPDSLKVAFKTKGGRVVYDGGGIDPDIKTKKDFMHYSTYALMGKGLIGDFATLYVARNPKPATSSEFNLSDIEYDKFLAFAKSKKFDYESQAEKTLKEFKSKAEDEKLLTEVQKDYDVLISKLKVAKDAELITNKKEIKEIIESEIVRRFYFKKGVVEHSFKNDIDIKEALKLISNTAEYNNILKSKK